MQHQLLGRRRRIRPNWKTQLSANEPVPNSDTSLRVCCLDLECRLQLHGINSSRILDHCHFPLRVCVFCLSEVLRTPYQTPCLPMQLCSSLPLFSASTQQDSFHRSNPRWRAFGVLAGERLPPYHRECRRRRRTRRRQTVLEYRPHQSRYGGQRSENSYLFCMCS